MIENPNDYEFVKFEKGRYPKKYNAVLKHKENGRMKRVPFGDARFAQYKDTTGLNVYSHLNHEDKARRRLYYDRHGMTAPLYSSKWFSNRFLWK